MVAPPPGSALRPIQVLEELLRPFAGQRASAISERLIARFGSLGGVLAATREQLDLDAGEDGDIGQLIIAARELVETAWREELIGSPVSQRDPHLLRFLRHELGNQRSECLYAVFFDSRTRFIRGEQIGEGLRSGMEARMGVLLRRAVELQAAGFLLAHNHPSGSPQPSAADRLATGLIGETARRVDLQLLDHLIVTSSAVYSIAQERLL